MESGSESIGKNIQKKEKSKKVARGGYTLYYFSFLEKYRRSRQARARGA
jgi:hypothetical protein